MRINHNYYGIEVAPSGRVMGVVAKLIAENHDYPENPDNDVNGLQSFKADELIRSEMEIQGVEDPLELKLNKYFTFMPDIGLSKLFESQFLVVGKDWKPNGD